VSPRPPAGPGRAVGLRGATGLNLVAVRAGMVGGQQAVVGAGGGATLAASRPHSWTITVTVDPNNAIKKSDGHNNILKLRVRPPRIDRQSTSKMCQPLRKV